MKKDKLQKKLKHPGDYPKEKKGEHVIGAFSRSNLYIFWAFFWLIIGFVILIVIVAFLGFSVFFTYAFIVWILFLGGFALYNFYIMRKSFTIITNLRIINIEQIGLLSKRVNEVDINNIERIAFKEQGVLEKLFKTGSIYLFIKHSNEFFPIEYVKEPKKIANRIGKII